MWRLVGVFAVTLCVALIVSPMTSSAERVSANQQATNAQFAHYGLGVLIPQNARDSGILASGAYVTIYAEPNKESGIVGYLESKSTADNAGLYRYSYEDPDMPPIEPGFFAKLFGEEPQIQWQYAPVKDVVIGEISYGLIIYERKAGWVRISVGWVESDGLIGENSRYVSWRDMYAEAATYKKLSRYFRSPEPDEIFTLDTLDTMRTRTRYEPINDATVYSSASFARPVTSIAAPLEVVILEQKGLWLRVFAVVSACENRKGKTDFREGTIGWISLIGPKGAPQLRVVSGECEEF